jgi:hypothetical protein
MSRKYGSSHDKFSIFQSNNRTELGDIHSPSSCNVFIDGFIPGIRGITRVRPSPEAATVIRWIKRVYIDERKQATVGISFWGELLFCDMATAKIPSGILSNRAPFHMDYSG